MVHLLHRLYGVDAPGRGSQLQLTPQYDVVAGRQSTQRRSREYVGDLSPVVYWGVYAVYQPPGFFDSVYSPQ